MKNYCYLLFLILTGFFISCNAPAPKPTPTTTLGFYTPYFVFPEQLNGQIKSVQEINYWALPTDNGYKKGSIITKKERDSLQWSDDFVATFAENGLITKTEYSNGDEFLSKWETEITDGKIKKAFYYKDDTLRRYDIFNFDESGFIESEQLFITSDSTKRTLKFTNDSLGYWYKMQYFDNEDNLKRVYTVERDNQNRVTKDFTYNQNDSLINSMEQTYNEYGFYNMSRSMNGLNDILSHIKVEYTSYDQMINWTNANIYMNDTLKVICDRIYEYY